MQAGIVENLSKIIAKLPGMGPRVAKRIVLHLAANKQKNLLPLIENLIALNERVHNCQTCGNLDEGYTCAICNNPTRDQSIICVVEEVADLWAIERAENFKGRYHVLGGRLSAIAGISIEDLSFEALQKRIKNEQIKEIIIATSATLDGQTTAHFVSESVKDSQVKVTRLAYGIPVGSEIDYLDEGTISIAFKSRAEI